VTMAKRNRILDRMNRRQPLSVYGTASGVRFQAWRRTGHGEPWEKIGDASTREIALAIALAGAGDDSESIVLPVGQLPDPRQRGRVG
jgi:hypothetical protein